MHFPPGSRLAVQGEVVQLEAWPREIFPRLKWPFHIPGWFYPFFRMWGLFQSHYMIWTVNVALFPQIVDWEESRSQALQMHSLGRQFLFYNYLLFKAWKPPYSIIFQADGFHSTSLSFSISCSAWHHTMVAVCSNLLANSHSLAHPVILCV